MQISNMIDESKYSYRIAYNLRCLHSPFDMYCLRIEHKQRNWAAQIESSNVLPISVPYNKNHSYAVQMHVACTIYIILTCEIDKKKQNVLGAINTE